MKSRVGVAVREAAPPVDQPPRRLRRGPLITLTCECGERRELRYGERWRCEKCGRSWNTSRIPIEQYAQVRTIQLRLRRVMTGLCVLALSCVIFFIVIGKVIGGVLLVATCAIGWRIYIWPRQKARYLDEISNLPSWEIEPD